MGDVETLIVEYRHPISRHDDAAARHDDAAGRHDDAAPPDAEWVTRLSATGRVRAVAVGHLHELMLRAAGHQVGRMPEAGRLGAARRAEIVHSAADAATVSVLSRLESFEGRSRFTTWAYKFAILHAGVEVRRAAWRDREVPLREVPEVPDGRDAAMSSPEAYVEVRELAEAVREGIGAALTPHQRRIMIAVLIDEVPIDVLAERLETTRGALYKTLHDGRQRLRAFLSERGFMSARGPKEVDS
ncbi:sigma-70 family RNA polymerase sigma factor [Agromyces neolithicus]|uniref:RNA polymerase sigma factor n=1 Tax=Agromyces neolithicus TaxID=269420 RepID=A0ABP4YL09_9MICO